MRALIMGGAGFFGFQSDDRPFGMGEEGVHLDNLSRKGGRQNLAWLKENHGAFPFEHGGWRPRDHRVLISDVRKAAQDFDWRPSVPPKEGIAPPYAWASENAHLFKL